MIIDWDFAGRKVWLAAFILFASGGEASRSIPTIERWYYVAKNSDNPIDDLATKLRADRGGRMLENSKLAEMIQSQYRDHPAWTRTLHHKNLEVLCAKIQDLGPMPSYSTLKRYMVDKGMVRISNL